MKKRILIPLLPLFLTAIVHAQNITPPKFPGGDEAFNRYTGSPYDDFSIDYNCDIEVTFVVKKNGKLDEIKTPIPNPEADGCIFQVFKLLKHSPRWSPALIAGKPIAVPLKLTVHLNYHPPDKRPIGRPGKNFVYTNLEEMPQFIGGVEAFYSYIKANMAYPTIAVKNGTQGKVIVGFIVERNGKLTQLKVSRGIGDGCDEEALRLIKKTSKQWIPGKRKGIPVRTAFSMPVDFSL